MASAASTSLLQASKAPSQRAARAADEAAAQASMRRGGDWLRLEGLRAREKAGKPLDDVDAKMLRRLEAKHDGAVFAAARLRGIKEREATEAAAAQRLREMKRRDEEIQLQRKLEKQKRWSRVRRFFGAGKRAPRRVPRGDGDESTVAPTVAPPAQKKSRASTRPRSSTESSSAAEPPQRDGRLRKTPRAGHVPQDARRV